MCFSRVFNELQDPSICGSSASESVKHCANTNSLEKYTAKQTDSQQYSDSPSYIQGNKTITHSKRDGGSMPNLLTWTQDERVLNGNKLVMNEGFIARSSSISDSQSDLNSKRLPDSDDRTKNGLDKDKSNKNNYKGPSSSGEISIEGSVILDTERKDLLSCMYSYL